MSRLRTIDKMHALKGKGSLNQYIKKALLTSAPTSGGAFSTEQLEKIVSNTIQRLAPEIAVIQSRFWGSTSYDFNQRIARPRGGRAQGEGATTTRRASQSVRKNLPLKIIRGKGAVTNFIEEGSDEAFDVAADEMESHVETQAYDIIFYNDQGNNEANEFEPSGLDSYIGQTTKSINRLQEPVAGVVATLTTFDDMLDAVTPKGADKHNRVFRMDPTMLSHLSRLISATTRTILESIGGGLREVMIGGGHRLMAYRGVPIISSSMMAPTEQMTAVTTGTATTGGSIPDDEYFFQVSVVTIDGGEQEATAEFSQTTSGGNASTLTLDWSTAFPNAGHYRIYAGLSTGDVKLVRILTANEYDTTLGNEGEIIGDITDFVFTENPTVPDSTVTGSSSFPNVKRQDDRPLVRNGGIIQQQVQLWDLDEIQGMGRFAYTNKGGSKFKGLITVKQLAETDDFLEFLVKTYGALVPSFTETSVLHRGLRVA